MASSEAVVSSRYKTLSLLLTTELKFVISYVTWMEELATEVETSALNKTDSLGNYLKLILEDEKMLQRSVENGLACGEVAGGEDEDSDWMDNVGHAAMKLNFASMYTYIGNLTSAKAYLDQLKGEYLDTLKLTTTHREVIEYFRDSLEWTIDTLQKLEDDRSNSVVTGFSKLQCRWEGLTDGNDNQVQATLAFLKACLSSAMKVPEKISSDLLIQAIKLDPDCHIWYHYAYRIVRRIRRNIKRSFSFKLPSPSADEEALAKRAYELCPDDVVTLTDHALLLKEKLWMENQAVWKQHEGDYLKCVKLFEQALKLADETGNRKWLRKIKVYLAEFLAFGKGMLLDQNAGKNMFDELAIEYPNSTFVLHKVGKLYHHGLYRRNDDEGTAAHDGKCVDLERAKGVYKRAIDSNPCNFACVMDYLKLLRRLHDYNAMIDSIDQAMQHSKRDHQVVKLLVIKSYITWIFNPKKLPDPRSATIELWTSIINDLPPEFASDIYYTRDSICFDRNHVADKIRKDILEYLEGIKNDCLDEHKLAQITSIIEGLTKSINRKREPRRMDNRNHRQRGEGEGQVEDVTEKMKRLFSSHNPRSDRQREVKTPSNQECNAPGAENNSAANQRRPQSLADADTAWREKKTDK